ncbi:hemerythrin domain-containing protein [Azoarcus sp. DN11]|uniref:bacteriohemerythrin n=1 Tax=Azoarcus sp. DN11 TaxID=356837 RepID=UPI000EABBED1|nr:hemerythrin domain-containing protein [Azoarcus sp. DN11]AYH41934.1 hemerythrin [Azoarcus sp. DN11]
MIDIKWDSKFEIGHPRIDAEHRAFVDLIRAVSVEAERDCPKEKALRLLLEVRKYAEFHFISEENIMLDIGYPDYDEHRDEHAWLLRRLENEVHAYYTDSAPLEELAQFMFNWFALHTTTVDKKLVACIAAHEAAART